jgi:hypothetical protein
MGPERPLGFATDVIIEETDGPDGRPRSIRVRAEGGIVSLELGFVVDDVAQRSLGAGAPGGGGELLQLRGSYGVKGQVGRRAVDFRAAGAAETFRFQRRPD